jgi:predicted DCC family thiol-disulfide oxidoreductase YuxK
MSSEKELPAVNFRSAQAEGEKPSAEHPVIVFDALCVLCSANAQFVLKHDSQGRFRLASMQGEVGSSLFRRFGIDPADPETMVLVEGDRCFRDSDAVLAIYSGLGWPWRAFAVFRLVPRPVRDAVYRFFARNRYRWFGRRETCWVPRPDQMERIL